MPETAFVTTSILIWARMTARMAPEDAAAKVSVSVEKLLEWESGVSYPTIRQAEKLAKAYRRPFALFFLPDIPNDFKPLQDFRRRGAKQLGTASVFIIREMQQKQAWLSDEFQANGEPRHEFVGRFALNDNPVEVAEHVRTTLQIDPRNYSGKNPLREWTDKAETKGIFVSRTSFIHSRMKLDCEEFQGFAISDPFAPLIFVNSDDWDAPLLFTLVHELAHLWIAESGVSNITEQEIIIGRGLHPVELFCNEVAANALMPLDLMQTISPSVFRSTQEIYKKITNLGLGISVFAFLVRSYKLGLIHLDRYRKLKLEADKEFAAYKKREEDRVAARRETEIKRGPSYYLLQVNKNGRLFTQIVLDAYKGGLIEPTQASHLLNVKVNNFQGLEAQLSK